MVATLKEMHISTLDLQRDIADVLEMRNMFHNAATDCPELRNRLAPDADIVRSPVSEYAVALLQVGRSTELSEIKSESGAALRVFPDFSQAQLVNRYDIAVH